ncbi:unnamed protein product [Didymodactylos carnosus]|uniref:Uncharacterized protein n=1 Tax=Didymodactylos carnosus TaxID=1234261 RepID=A0A8S2HW16_9BILA|nr:unnamed protein product [Didymodactylos carnosus]CAF3690095.1 unnamed protein product [Didymodactylos carnosus]
MDVKPESMLQFLLQVGTFGIFLGHGVLALGGPDKQKSWLNYLYTAGFNYQMAKILLPLVGALDICCSFIILLKPHPLVTTYCAVWGFATALMRPLSGESPWQFVERAGNWICPLALLYTQTHKTHIHSDDTQWFYYLQIAAILTIILFFTCVILRILKIFPRTKEE